MPTTATITNSNNEIVDWLTFHNYPRLHSPLGYVSSMQCNRLPTPP